MAGIGFELRKYLNDDSFSGTVKAYGFAGLISAGPWVLSILGVMLIGIVALSQKVGGREVEQFTTSVTWIMGSSLVLSGLLQLVFTRFIADRLFEGRANIINSNLFGAMLLTTLVSGAIGLAILSTIFHEPLSYELLMLGNFVTLNNVWIVVIFVAGLKKFKYILYSFAAGYSTTVVLSILLIPYGMNGLLAGLLAGHAVLLFSMLAVIIPEHPLKDSTTVRADFLKIKQIFPILIFIGFFYNIGIWIDKLMFWFHPGTSEAIIGPLRASLIYDLPIFLAYLSIIPGMAVFLLRIETDFAEAYDGFFAAVRGNASLQEIETLGNEMILAVREGIFQIIKVQGITVLVLYMLGPKIVAWLGISDKFIHLYYIDLVGVAAQVLMLAVLNVLFYLDRLTDAFWLTLTLFISNSVFTWITLQMGPMFYGYGFGLSMTLTAFVGIFLLSSELENIEFRTFMRPREATA